MLCNHNLNHGIFPVWLSVCGIKDAKLVVLNCTEMLILLQVHYPPYLFECFLFAPVHDLESAAEIGNGAAIFKLKKADAGIWPSLQSPGSG